MKVEKSDKLINFIIYNIFIISMLSYEIHLKNYYTNFQFGIVVLSFIVFIIFYSKKKYNTLFTHNIKNNKIVLLLFFLMILTTLFAMLKYPQIEFQTFIIVILFSMDALLYFCMFPVYYIKNKSFANNLMNLVIFSCLFFSIFGIIIYYKKNFLGYSFVDSRLSSIFFDPNFFSVIIGLPCFLVFYKKDYNIFVKIFIWAISFYAVYLSGSRGTMLSLVLCIAYYIITMYSNKNIIKKIITIILSFMCVVILFNFLESNGFLRLYQGSNGRFEMITYGFQVIKESPFFGFGYGSVANILKAGAFLNGSTHNSIIDFMLNYGIICTIIYIIIIIKSIFSSFNDSNKLYINLVIVYLVLNMNTILYSFGGVGFPSLMLTFFLGLACVEVDYDKKNL